MLTDYNTSWNLHHNRRRLSAHPPSPQRSKPKDSLYTLKLTVYYEPHLLYSKSPFIMFILHICSNLILANPSEPWLPITTVSESCFLSHTPHISRLRGWSGCLPIFIAIRKPFISHFKIHSSCVVEAIKSHQFQFLF